MKKVAVAITIGLVLVALIIAFGQVFTVRYIDVEFVNAVVTADKNEIIDATGIDTNTNIFILDEKKVKAKIQNAFSDNAIKVNDIVREFPNKVTIKISERTPLFKIKAETEEKDGFVTVDRNFQRTYVYSEEEISREPLIEVKGFVVEDTYLTDECYALRDVANALIDCGFNEEAIPYLIKTIEFTDGSAKITLRSDEVTFVLTNYDEIEEKIKRLCGEYEATDFAARNGKIYTA